MKKERQKLLLLPIVVVACFAFFIIWIATMRWGVGLSFSHVAVFMQSAWALASGQGFLVIGPDGAWHAMKSGAPLYSMLLSLAPFLGVGMEEWIRILHSVFFGVLVFVSGALIFVVSRHIRFAVISAMFVMLMVFLSRIFMNASMLPLLIVLMSLSFLFLMLSQEDDVVDRKKFLRLSALFAGLSSLVSYSGFVVILAEFVFLYWFSLLEKKDRLSVIKEFFMFSLILPLAVYATRYWMMGTLGIGISSLPILGSYQYLNVIDMVTRWFLPASLPLMFRIIFTLGVFFLFGRLLLRIRQQATLGKHEFNLASLLSIFLIVQSVLIVCVLLLRGPEGYLRELLITACWVFAMLVVLVLARVTTPMVRSRFSMGIIVLFLVMSFGLIRTIKTTRNFFLAGEGYSGKGWQTAAIVKQIKTLADYVNVYTDRADVFYLLTKRSSMLIPKKDLKNQDWFKKEAFVQELKERKAFVVLFNEEASLKETDIASWMQEVKADVLFRDGKRVIIGCRL